MRRSQVNRQTDQCVYQKSHQFLRFFLLVPCDWIVENKSQQISLPPSVNHQLTIELTDSKHQLTIVIVISHWEKCMYKNCIGKKVIGQIISERPLKSEITSIWHNLKQFRGIFIISTLAIKRLAHIGHINLDISLFNSIQPIHLTPWQELQTSLPQNTLP